MINMKPLHEHILLILLAIVISLAVYYYIINLLIQTPVYTRYTTGGFDVISSSSNTVGQNAYNRINYSLVKGFDTTLVTGQTPYLQIALGVATAMLGLYFLVLLEVIKTLTQKVNYVDHKRYLIYLFMLISVLPFPILFADLSNVSNSTVLENNMAGSMNT